MDELKKKRSLSETNIKPEYIIGRQRSSDYIPEKQRSHSESDLERVGIQKQNNKQQEIQIEEVANVIPHRFANKTDMRVKLLTEDNREQIEENPFELLASCKRWKSSKEMKRIKDSLTKIEALMDYNISKTKQEFAREQTQIVAAYNEVITHCESYVNSKRPRTKNGKMRKEMVQSIENKCRNELAVFEDISTNTFHEAQKGKQMQWIDVLRGIRTENIDMDAEGREVEIGGAATSDVLICHIDGETKYFKKNEKFNANVAYTEFAYREIENAKPDSIQEKIKNYFTENQGMEWAFEEILGVLAFADINHYIYTTEINDESFLQIKNRLIEEILLNANFLNSVCNDVHSMNEFIDFCKTVKRYEDMRSFASDTAKIKTDSVLSSHNVATLRVANLLGAPELIATSKNVSIRYRGETIKGCMMDEAEGETYADLYKEAHSKGIEIKFSENALRQIYTLQLLDYLCGQVDRNSGNFMCAVNKNDEEKIWEIKNLTGIDNDMSFGEIDLEEFKLKYKDPNGFCKLPPLTNPEGEFSIPAVDYWVNHRLMTLTPELLTFSLKDLLSESALNAAVKRLKTLQNDLEDEEKNRHIDIISRNKGEWYLWENAYNRKPSDYIL